ncbi:PAS domain-containing protein [Massilia sp. CF038]|uniref:PAS domain-containing protein n=1 Tax=Massilia sp. CF038 TaxID=1881045 RepID=UPI00091931A8|nr:PAS domain-containing protein [Massilia sp. CF038]SHG67253.1 PAS domain S-box-containing protein [Massilia sp. CF038]
MPENADGGTDRDLILQEDDPDDLFAASAQDSVPWRILIVDDDVDVHVVTKFALSNTKFQGRRLSFLHAYTGQEALAIMQETPDIALVLLDVIMETPDAGLWLARQIREQLGNDMVRIVLRTGQPGQALEHSIIVDYDINDFWCKTDLTTRKLFTTVISSLRAYASLAAASAQRQALRNALSRAQQLNAVVEQHALVLTLDGAGRITDANPALCRLAGWSREALLGRDLHALHAAPFPEPLRTELVQALAREGGWAGDIATHTNAGAAVQLRCAALAFRDAGGTPYQYVAVATRLDPT